MKRVRDLFVVLCVVAAAGVAQDAERQRFTVEDLWSMGRLSDPQVSPDGKTVAFVVGTNDMEANTSSRAIHLLPLAGGEARRITDPKDSASSPRYAADGTLYYRRKGQIWRHGADGKAEQVTKLPIGLGSYAISKDGKHFVATASVYPDVYGMDANKKRLDEQAKKKSKARIYTKLLYRHWNQWRDGRRSHVLLLTADGKFVRDLTPGDADTPPVSLEGSTGFTLSPDGEVLAFTRNGTEEPAVNTNNDIFSAFTKGGSLSQVTSGQGNDHSPHFSPDGRYLAYLSMARGGFEADRNVLMVREQSTGKSRPLTAELDRSVREYIWARDGRHIFFTVTDEGRVVIYKVKLTKSGKPRRLYAKGVSSSLQHADLNTLAFLNQGFDRPPELWKLNLTTETAEKLSAVNDAILARVEMGKVKEFWYTGAGGDKVQGFVIHPPNFNPSKNYPAVMLIHGGPQGAFMDSFHWRWNAQLWAAPGHVAVIVNFHGSRGYGQKFCDAVSRDWGGAPYEDVMKGLDYALDRFPFIDKNRVGAAGGSYGGYMVNWICGKTDRFKCLVSHAGIAENVSMFGATEEIWFPLWEFEKAPWESSRLHDQYSPVRLAANFKTPTLVIHGEKDYRVPYSQGLQMFTALKVRGVEAKLLFFPDEDHFVRKPQNAKVWWNTIHDWLAKHLVPAPSR